MDDKSVPIYDRGYALGLFTEDSAENKVTTEANWDPSRCFNCSSYNHSLKDCPKPRDNSAVNDARREKQKQIMSKRKRGSVIGNSTRYYQESPGGKYDGLKPGSLDTETRKLLGIGELEPPPWLNRMRKLGYPPGYLLEDEDEKAPGIKIHEDISPRNDCEDIEASSVAGVKKEAVKFPGINAPIPKNADETLWRIKEETEEPPPRSYGPDHYSEGRSPFTPVRHVLSHSSSSSRNSPLPTRMGIGGMPMRLAGRWPLSPGYYLTPPPGPYGSSPFFSTSPVSPYGHLLQQYHPNPYFGSGGEMQHREIDGRHHHPYSDPDHHYRDPDHNYRDHDHHYRDTAHNYRDPNHNYRDPNHNYRDRDHHYRDPAHRHDYDDHHYRDRRRHYSGGGSGSR